MDTIYDWQQADDEACVLTECLHTAEACASGLTQQVQILQEQVVHLERLCQDREAEHLKDRQALEKQASKVPVFTKSHQLLQFSYTS